MMVLTESGRSMSGRGGISINSKSDAIFHFRVAEYSQTDWGIARVKEWGHKSGHLEDEDILI